MKNNLDPQNINTEDSPAPFHLMKILDEYILFDVSSNRFYKISKIMFHYLTLCLKYGLQEARKIFQNDKQFSCKDINNVISEVETLAGIGLFDTRADIDYKKRVDTIKNADLSKHLNGIELLVTDQCNLACKYCYCAFPKDTPDIGLMTQNTAQKGLKILFNSKNNSDLRRITIFGGEPLLNKKLIDYIMEYSGHLAQANNKKTQYVMTTNATLIDEKIINYIVKHKFGLMVSLDGPQAIHDAQCPTKDGKGSYRQATEGIRKLMKKRPAVTVRCTIAHPVPNLRELLDFFDEFGFNNIVLGYVFYRSEFPTPLSFDDNDIEYLVQQEEELLADMIAELKKHKLPKYFPYKKYLGVIMGNIPWGNAFYCGAANSSACVDTDGNIVPCHRFGGMKKWSIGNVESGIDFDRCKEFWIEYNKCTAEMCNHCWAFSICRGPCPWMIAQQDGTFKANYNDCVHLKEIIKRAAYVFLKMQDFHDDSLKNLIKEKQDGK